MLLVISPPSINNEYYLDNYDAIVAFDIAYAKSIMGHDNVVVLGDKPTLKYLQKHLPKDILLEQSLADIWLRDCSMVNPHQPVQFRYAAAAQGTQADADYVQKKFNKLTRRHQLEFKRSSYILDGGNYVDNYKGRAVVSDRFLEDNDLDYKTGKTILKELLNLQEVAIIPTDDPDGLAHADGQVMFIDENTIAVTDYQEPDFQESIHQELEAAFPGIQLIKIPTEFDHREWDPNFHSALGIHINGAVTNQYIYLPIFNKNTDAQAIQLIQQNSPKTVVPIDASKVAMLGGSVRCLSWQLVGNNAEKLILAARK